MAGTILRATPEDLPQVAALRWQWVAEDPLASQLEGTFEQFVTVFVDWAARSADTHVCFVARIEGAMVGMAWLAIAPRVPSPRSYARANAELQSVYVIPAERGRGLGAALIAASVAAARELGVERLTVHSSERGVPAYISAGFAASPLLLELTVSDPARLPT